MKPTIKNKRRRLVTFLAILFSFITVVLAYFQLFYKSKRVDAGYVKLERIIKDHGHIVTAVRFTSNDSFVVSGSVDKTIKIHETQSGKLVRSFSQPEGITYLDLGPDDNDLVTSSYDGKIRLWRISDASVIKEFDGHSGTAWTVAFSPDG